MAMYSNRCIRYAGGTKGLSELACMSTFREKFEYIQEHADINIQNRLDTRKNPEIASKWKHNSTQCPQDLEVLHEMVANCDTDDIPELHDLISKSLENLGLSPEHLKKTFENDQEAEQISSKLKIENSPKKGRFVVATEDIEPGDLIISETPSVTYLHHNNRYKNCCLCLRPLIHSVPSDNCNQYLFCSQNCKDKGKFHLTECGNTDLIPAQGKVSLIIRLFSTHSLPHFLENKSKIVAEVLKPAELVANKDAFSLFQLQAGNRKDSVYNMEKLAWSYYILFVLHKMGFFHTKDFRPLGEEELFIAELVDRLLRIADDNCHEICELDIDNLNSTSTLQDICEGREDIIRVIGAGIFPNISLFNNSCDVNTMKVHNCQGKETIVAKRKIRAGEEVSDFYGEHYFLADKFSRRKNLGFSCCCKACMENYPLRDNLPDFSNNDLATCKDWALHRIHLEHLISGAKITDNNKDQLIASEVKTTCMQMAAILSVRSPHEAFIVPEMYLTLANLIEDNNKSLTFLAWMKNQTM